MASKGPKADARALEKELKAIKSDIKGVQNEQDVLSTEERHFANIRKYAAKVLSESSTAKDLPDWEKTLAFLEKKSLEIDGKKVKLQRKLRDLYKHHGLKQKQLNQVRNPNGLRTKKGPEVYFLQLDSTWTHCGVKSGRALLTMAKVSLTEPPRRTNAVIPASETRDAINAYSIAVAPVSSRENSRSKANVIASGSDTTLIPPAAIIDLCGPSLSFRWT